MDDNGSELHDVAFFPTDAGVLQLSNESFARFMFTGKFSWKGKLNNYTAS